MLEKMINLENVSKTFVSGGKTVKAVDNVSLNVPVGHVFGIIGPSGAGKSTLIRCINMLERPDSGRVTVAGTDLTAVGEKELRVCRQAMGMIFQHFNLFPSRTVLGNVIFPMGHRADRKKAVSHAMDLLSMVGMAEKADSYPNRLSGGQQQRAAIARALALSPSVLLCDEATSALDPENASQILELLKKLNKELGLTILMVSHQMDAIKEICTDIAVMDKGKVAEQGGVYDVFHSPSTELASRLTAPATCIGRSQSFVDRFGEILTTGTGEWLVRLRFDRDTVVSPVISRLSAELDVRVNIVFADMDLLEGIPFGCTVAKLTGKRENIERFLQSFAEGETEVIYHG